MRYLQPHTQVPQCPGHFRLMSLRWVTLVSGILLLFTSWTHADPPAPDDDVPATAAALEYNRVIRPILADACFSCHGPDSAARKADLRLDQREAAIELGAITPGDPANSELIARIMSDDPDAQMPPPATKKTLTEAQKEILSRWIQQGAEYQLHWSFIAPQRPPVPTVKRADWVQNPIDAFVLARLEADGLEPAPAADRATIARRLSYDLTGLPPHPDEVAEFVNDPDPNAYEKLVDRWLTSNHWGEHRGRYWLDYARYADTHGIHFDNFREMWTYRDWVINAFNANLPFDRFTIENLAGDLLPNRTLDQQIGSGFNRCNMTTNEGGIIDEEYRVLYARDRTETTSQVWLGLTAGCAVCHSHKFDPLSQREFYEMSAFFNNTTQPVRDGNVKDTPPIVTVPLQADRERWEQVPALLAAAQASAEARKSESAAEFQSWLSSAKDSSLGQDISAEGLHLRASLDEGSGTQTTWTIEGLDVSVPLSTNSKWDAEFSGQRALQVQGEVGQAANVGNFSGEQAFSCAAWVNLPASDGYGAIAARMTHSGQGYRGWDFWQQQRRIGMHLVSNWPDRAIKVVGRDQIPANQWVHVVVTYDGSQHAAGVQVYYDGQSQPTNVENDSLSDSIQIEVPFRIGQRDQGELLSGALRDVRLYRRVLPPAEVASLASSSRFATVLAKAPDQRSEAELAALKQFWLTTLDPEYQARTQAVQQLEQERDAIRARGTIAHVMQESDEPAKAYLLYRGEYDQRRDEVTPGTPQVLPAFPADLPRNRLGFAQWLLLPDQPLTSRVTVNRFWQEVFGTGIVKTTGDFGVSGELPSHPELLDWLAVEFRESGWDVKRFFKLIVMSSTYRQSAELTQDKIDRDPENRLLTRGPRFRMDAEMVRDTALVASGLLVPTIGGPSVKPYQPPGVWEAIAMNVSNTRSYTTDQGDSLYRRSMYTFIKRMAPPASMEIFNAPNREICVVRRERTNTPLQALTTLNDEQFIEAARQLASHTLRQAGPEAETRVQWMGRRILSRDFRPDELTIILDSGQRLMEFYQSHPDEARELLSVGAAPVDPAMEPRELAAWTMLANELMNLDEALNK